MACRVVSIAKRHNLSRFAHMESLPNSAFNPQLRVLSSALHLRDRGNTRSIHMDTPYLFHSRKLASRIQTTMSAASARDDVLEISVGGTVFSCRRSTLRLEKESLLSKMFDPDSNFGDLTRDPVGRPFIDRDGDIFATILKYLRNNGSLARLHELSLLDLAELQEEAEYFSLQNLVNVIQSELKEREEAKEKKRKEREDEGYEKRVRKKWAGVYSCNPTCGQECVSFICNVDDVAAKINEITCASNEHNRFEVHSVVPILINGCTVKMSVLLTGTQLVEIPGPSPEEQRILHDRAS